MNTDQNTATIATIIKDSFTHRIQSAHVDGMEYLINVHLPPTYGMSEDTYPVIYYTDAFVCTEITTGTKKILELPGQIANTILVGISHEGNLMQFVSYRSRDLIPTQVSQDNLMEYPVGAPESGGAEHFLAFIAHELFPSLRRNIESTQAIVALLDRAMVVYSRLGRWSIARNCFKDISLLAPPCTGTITCSLNRKRNFGKNPKL